MLRSRHTFCLITLACLAGHARAQSFTPWSTHDWPTGNGALAQVQHIVSGRFLDMGETDVAFRANGVPYLLVSPGSLGTYTPIPLTSGEVVNDMTCAPGLGSDGRDGLASVGSAGLRLRWYSSTSNSITWSSLSTNANWIGALGVRAADLDASGVLDYVGIGSTGQFLVFRFNNGTQAPRVNFGSAILDVQPAQWDADSASELAVLTTWGLYVIETSGAIDAQYARPGASGGAIAVVQAPGSSTSILEWMSPSLTPGVHPSLYEITAGAGSAQLVISDLGRNFGKLAAADMPPVGSSAPDGRTDLLFLGTDNCAPALLRQQTGTPRFNTGSGAELVNPAPGSCQAWDMLATQTDLAGAQDPFFGDLTADGIPDILIGIGNDSDGGSGHDDRKRVELLRGIFPGVNSPSPAALVFKQVALGPRDSGHSNQRHVFLQINTDSGTLPAGTILSSSDGVELNVWTETDGFLQAPSALRTYTKIPTGGGGTGSVVNLDFWVTESQPCFNTPSASQPSLFWVEVRFVTGDTGFWSGSTTTATPSGTAYVGYLGTDINLMNSCFITGQSDAYVVLLPYGTADSCWTGTPGVGPGCGNGTVFTRTAAYGTRPRVRPDPNNTPPTKTTTITKVTTPVNFPTGWN